MPTRQTQPPNVEDWSFACCCCMPSEDEQTTITFLGPEGKEGGEESIANDGPCLETPIVEALPVEIERAPKAATGRPWREPMSDRVINAWNEFKRRVRLFNLNPLIYNVDDVARDTFKKIDLPPRTMGNDRHSHGPSANSRTRGQVVADALAVGCGLGGGVYSYQMSKEDQRKGRAGCRKRFWAKDFRVKEQADVFHMDRHLRYLCDVDYYMEDFEHMMATVPGITLLYTVAPVEAANNEGDYTWTFTADNHLDAVVSGLAKYRHKLWDYGTDCLTYTSRFRKMSTTYLVERVQMSESHQCILLAPVFSTNWWQPYFGSYGRNLPRRFEPVTDGVVAMHVKTKTGGDMMSFTTAGSFKAVTIPYDMWLAGSFAAAQPKSEVNIATMRTWVDKTDDTARRVEASIWTEVVRKRSHLRPLFICPVEFANQSYTCNVEAYGDGDEGAGLMMPFMSPLDNRGYTPRKGPYTDKWGVQSRVLNLIEKNCKLGAPRPELTMYMHEFTRGFMKTLYPTEIQTVYDNQTRPSQKMLIYRAGKAGAFIRSVTAFTKAECYGGIKDPRIITQFDGTVKIEYATYAMALAEYIKEFPWYGFKRPVEIAQAVADATAGAAYVIETDFSRFDGHVTQLIRKHVDLPILMHCFPHNREAVFSAYKQHHDNTVRIGEFKFQSGATQSSGSADTSVMNTLRNRAIIYCAWRHAGLSHEEAFEAPGMHGGDDGLVVIPRRLVGMLQTFLDSLESVCRAFGMQIESVVRKRGTPFTFLARYFNAWDGDLQSMCDVQRQMKKLHMTVGTPQNPRELLRQKAEAFLLTDANTPIIGDFCQYVRKTIPAPRKIGQCVDVNWWAQYAPKDQFPNEYVSWMDEVIVETYPEFDMATMRRGFEESHDPLHFPQCVADPVEQPATKTPVAMNGDIVQSNQQETTKSGHAKTNNPDGAGSKNTAQAAQATNAAAGGKGTRGASRTEHVGQVGTSRGGKQTTPAPTQRHGGSTQRGTPQNSVADGTNQQPHQRVGAHSRGNQRGAPNARGGRGHAGGRGGANGRGARTGPAELQQQQAPNEPDWTTVGPRGKPRGKSRPTWATPAN